MNRTRYGLVLAPDPSGRGNVWATPDGRYHVVQDYEPTTCENPHPGCEGDQEHDQLRWFVYEMTTGDNQGALLDSYDTLRGAAQATTSANPA